MMHDPPPPLLRAAELIEREARSLYESHTVNGDWGFAVLEHADYDEMKAIANELRRAAGDQTTAPTQSH